MSNISSTMNVMMDISAKASRFLSRDYYELKSLQSSRKSMQPFVDKTLHKMRSVILSELERVRPEYGIDCIDFQKESTSEHQETWIVNIMDGVDNFAHAIPFFGIGIAVEENIHGKRELTYGLVAFPILDELYFAERGKGSWYIGSTGKFSATHRLRVSERKAQDQLLLLGSHANFPLGAAVRNFGCNLLSCAYVASGRADFAIMNDAGVTDTAAGVILVKEAGGVVQKKNDSIMISNPALDRLV